MRYARFSIYVLYVLAASAKADQFCFALAATYYEQVYCQLQAKAQTKNLPSFNQFKKNTEAVQASLLKRPAERNGIKLPLPKVVNTSLTQPPVAREQVVETNEPLVQVSRVVPIESLIKSAGCELVSGHLHCATGNYRPIGNRANHRLAKKALTAENTMNLPAYTDGQLNQYLARAYQQYILKMCDIGLGGVTMTYRKFAFLYHDIQTKGLDFSQRFETMFNFLKKDKASMGVSESSTIPKGLSVQDCSPLTDIYYVCDYQNRNYIFVKQ